MNRNLAAKGLSLALAAAFMTLAAARPARAQFIPYFGKNKVR